MPKHTFRFLRRLSGYVVMPPERHYLLRNTALRDIFRRVWLATLAVLLSVLTAFAQEDSEPVAFDVGAINQGLPVVEPPVRLDTPRAALESFFDAVNAGDRLRAAQALNLRGIPEEERAARGPLLAMQLAYLLLRHDLIDWSEVPDQPDARVLPDTQAAASPYSRRAIALGEIDLDGRPVPVSLQRFNIEGAEPVWLFSPFVVERVDRLYTASRPGLLSEWIPLQDRIETLGKPSLREWLVVVSTLVASGLLGLAIHWMAKMLSRRVGWRVSRWLRGCALPLATVVAALTFRVGIDKLILLTGPIASKVDIGSEVVALIAGAWLLNQSLSTLTLALSVKYVVPLSDDPDNRRIKTNVYVIRRLAVVFIAVVSIGYILLRLGLFETFGISVLASAGALGLIVAIAAQPLMSNVVAGLQIALSDPVRVGDVVTFDDNLAIVDDIAFAHTVLRTYNNTRLIVPHAEFLSRVVENWSKDGEAVKRIIKLPVDYRIEVERVRQEVQSVVDGDPRLTEAPVVEMVDVSEDAALLWIWISASTPATAWDLHNEVREKLMRFLAEFEGGAYLPRQRHVVLGDETSRLDAKEAS